MGLHTGKRKKQENSFKVLLNTRWLPDGAPWERCGNITGSHSSMSADVSVQQTTEEMLRSPSALFPICLHFHTVTLSPASETNEPLMQRQSSLSSWLPRDGPMHSYKRPRCLYPCRLACCPPACVGLIARLRPLSSPPRLPGL